MLHKRVSYQKFYDHLKIVQTIVIYYQDKLFSDKVVAGYRAQIFYDRLPVGEPMEKIVYQAKTVDREAVSAALELALQGLQKGLMKGFKLGDIQAVINRILPK